MAVIAHVTLPPFGSPGPFVHLYQLSIDDTILYQTATTTYIYKVTHEQVIPPDFTEPVYLQDGSKLLLLTCTNWNASERKYDHRLLIEASLVRSEMNLSP